MRHLADDIVLSVKDALRNLRYVIRSEAERGAPVTAGARVGRRARPPLGYRRGHVAGLVDRMFTEVEAGALAVMSPGRMADGGVSLRPIDAYFAPGLHGEAASRLFAHAHYQAAKALMRRQGARNVLILEQVVARAHGDMLADGAPLIAAVRAAPASGAHPDWVRLCAATACRLAAARPIRQADPRMEGDALSRAIAEHPNAYCFVAYALATAIVSVRDAAELPTPAETVESAAAVVEARFERVLAALAAADPVTALALEIENVLPVLP